MKNGICPKCNQKEIYIKEKPIRSARTSLPVTNFSIVKIQSYVCVHCGYMEDYVYNDVDLLKIKEKWHKVNSN